MAWSSETPADWISSWSEDGTTVSFDLADVTPTLTAAEADATTGDLRAILLSLIDHTFTYYNALASADKPTKMTISKTSQFTDADTLKSTYAFTFYNSIVDQNVESE